MVFIAIVGHKFDFIIAPPALIIGFGMERGAASSALTCGGPIGYWRLGWRAGFAKKGRDPYGPRPIPTKRPYPHPLVVPQFGHL